MLKIEEGMYIRTKNGIIRKWDKYDRLIIKWEERYNFKDNYDDLTFEVEKDIVNASYSIINLIQKGDYVNGLPVRFIEKDNQRIDIGQTESYWWIYNNGIKDILTKEQYENNCYRIGD